MEDSKYNASKPATDGQDLMFQILIELRIIRIIMERIHDIKEV